MSSTERPELRAFRELETLVHSLGDELAGFRRRAISAEAQLRDSTHAPSRGATRSAATGDRAVELETENERLRLRLERAEDRVGQLMDRVRFLRQQLQAQGTTTASRS